MKEVYPIIPRPELTIPVDIIESIHDEQVQLEQELPIVAEHELVRRIVIVSNALLDERYIKRPIRINDSLQLSPDYNCTDTAIVQLRLIESLGLRAVARFDGVHASTILPMGDHFWHLNGNLTHEIQVSNKPKPSTDPQALSATKLALMELQQADAAYFYQTHEGEWAVQAVTEQGIRASSPTRTHIQECPDIEECEQRARILVKPPLAYDMLHAIDGLQQIKDAGQPAAYALAKTALKELVPYL